MEELFSKLFRDPPDVDDLAFEWTPRLAAFAQMGAGAVDFLRARLEDPSLVRRVYAVIALSHCVDRHESVCRSLCAELAHPHGLYRRHVRWALHRLAPASVPALIEALSIPTLRREALRALAFVGPSASEAIDAVAPLANAGDPAAIEALSSLGGPWPSDPEVPIAYLGEHVRYFGPMPKGDRRAREAQLWCEQMSWFARHAELDAKTLADLSRWDDALEAEAAKYLDRWTPGRVVLARREVKIEFYDWSANDDVCVTIVSDDARGWTMGALLDVVNEQYSARSNANDRVFEGLRRTDEPGLYRVHTGS